jgi:hypothetical protein
MNFVHENCARVSVAGKPAYESVPNPSGAGDLFESVDPADREAFLSIPGMAEQDVPAVAPSPAPEPAPELAPVAVLSAEAELAPEPVAETAEPVADGPV